MIAKISTGKYTKGMVKYNHSKTEKDLPEGNKQALFLGMQNGTAKTLDEITFVINSFNQTNKRVKKPNMHISLNFHQRDLIDNNTMIQIANDYMDEMGMGLQPYAIYRHFDQNHPHIHIATTLIDNNGKKLNDSHIYRRSQKITRKLEEEYKLTKAVNRKETLKTKDLNSRIYNYFNDGREPLTPLLHTIIRLALDQKPTSEREFDSLLEKNHVKRILTNKEGGGGASYALIPLEEIEDYKVKEHRAIAAGDIDQDYNNININIQIEINSKDKRENLKAVMGKAYSVTNAIKKPIPLEDFITKMNKKGLKVEIKRRQSGDQIGKINGFIFKDSRTGITYNSSELKYKLKDLDALIVDAKKELNVVGDTQLDSEPSFPQHIRTLPANANTIALKIANLIESFEHSQSLQEEELAKKKRKKRRF